MRITKFEEYGLRLVLRLAAAGGQLTIRELAEREGIPEATVAKVIARLRAAGLVRAARGRNGGYALAEPASAITIARIVEAFDERLYDPGFCDRMAPGADDLQPRLELRAAPRLARPDRGGRRLPGRDHRRRCAGGKPDRRPGLAAAGRRAADVIGAGEDER